MRPTLSRIVVASLAAPVIALISTSAAHAHDEPPFDFPKPTAPAEHDHSGGGTETPAEGHSGHSGHSGEGGTETERPRAAVLGAFGAVNAGVLASAAVVRRRSRTRAAAHPRPRPRTGDRGQTR
ncbi:hypothetical protein [Streptomyces sp. NPDC047928]|uniref:hypothetical protein n=1 Tax=unclassified Streptomyces TaxID=2593676 RepID=UPI00371E8669